MRHRRRRGLPLAQRISLIAMQVPYVISAIAITVAVAYALIHGV